MTRAQQEPKRAVRLRSGRAEWPGPQPAATMLSRLLKEHQAKQNERKELQGEPNVPSAVFAAAAA